MKQPKHCKGCPSYHKAGHKEGSQYQNSRFTNWCCQYSTIATKAQSICKVQKHKGE